MEKIVAVVGAVVVGIAGILLFKMRLLTSWTPIRFACVK